MSLEVASVALTDIMHQKSYMYRNEKNKTYKSMSADCRNRLDFVSNFLRV